MNPALDRPGGVSVSAVIARPHYPGQEEIFFYPPLNKTFGQMTIAEKSQVSHRGKALNELKQEVDKVMIWIRMHMPPEEKFLYEQSTEDE